MKKPANKPGKKGGGSNRKGGGKKSPRKTGRRSGPGTLGGRATLILEIRQGGRRFCSRGQAKLPPKQVHRKANTSRLAGLVDTLTALGNAERIEVLLALAAGRSSHAELAAWTGLRPGPLYHHLNRLRLAGMLAVSRRNDYELTRRGREALLTALALGSAVGGNL